jgi:thiol-disulfide isomerase/thioredoxin
LVKHLQKLTFLLHQREWQNIREAVNGHGRAHYLSVMQYRRFTSVAAFGLLLLALVASACASSDARDDGPGVGADAELAPNFAVPTASGGEFSLAEHLATDGRPVFLNLWASWCFPCREEMPAISAASEKFTDIAFVGVAVQDSMADAQAFAEEIAVSYTIGFDENDAVDADYRPLGLPASYIISSDGVILERIFGKVTEEDLADKFATYFG